MRGHYKKEKPYIVTKTARHKAMGNNRIPTEIMHMNNEAEPFLAAARIQMEEAVTVHEKAAYTRMLPFVKGNTGKIIRDPR